MQASTEMPRNNQVFPNMPDTMVNAPVLPRRLLPTDFYKLQTWVFPKLKQRWPNVSDKTFAAWLMTYINDNNHCAFITDDAIAVAILQSDIRDSYNYVELLWVIHNIGHFPEAVACMKECIAWAKRMGAAEFRFDKDGDIPLQDKVNALGAPKKRVVHYMPLRTA
jgi:hypothetical protein